MLQFISLLIYYKVKHRLQTNVDSALFVKYLSHLAHWFAFFSLSLGLSICLEDDDLNLFLRLLGKCIEDCWLLC